MVESIGIEITTRDTTEQEGSWITKEDDYDNTKEDFVLKDEIVSNMNMRGGTTENRHISDKMRGTSVCEKVPR